MDESTEKSDVNVADGIPSNTQQTSREPVSHQKQERGVLHLAVILIGSSIVASLLGSFGVAALILFGAGGVILALWFRSSPVVGKIGIAWASPKLRGGMLAGVALLVLIAFLGGESLEEAAMPLVTESYQESGGTAECVEVEITGDGFSKNSYSAIATMSNGRTLPIIIVDGDDEISVSPVGGAQFGLFPKSRKK